MIDKLCKLVYNYGVNACSIMNGKNMNGFLEFLISRNIEPSDKVSKKSRRKSVLQLEPILCFAKPPIVGVYCNRSLINMSTLRFSRLSQFCYWLWVILAGLSAVIALITTILLACFSYAVFAVAAMLSGLILSCFFVTLVFINGDIVPPFVMKHMKTGEEAKYIKKRGIKR